MTKRRLQIAPVNAHTYSNERAELLRNHGSRRSGGCDGDGGGKRPIFAKGVGHGRLDGRQGDDRQNQQIE